MQARTGEEREAPAAADAAGDQAVKPGSRRTDRRLTIHAWLSRILRSILALGLLLAAWREQWMTAALIAAILAVTLIPAAAGRRFRFAIPPELELLAVGFVFASLFLGEVHGYYVRYAWWDLVLHASSGFLLGVLGFLLVHVLNEDERVELNMEPGFVAFFAFCFALAAGAAWEIFEYAMDSLFGMTMQASGLRDTMWDLILDAGGALVICALGFGWLRTMARSSFLERWIDGFISANPHLFRRRRDSNGR